ncbi:MAG TPA: carboxy terminal-processing peptidase [Firmicutes bacterium]|nr:carboxy terminal-processing peptidase [Bacillota bacterium]
MKRRQLIRLSTIILGLILVIITAIASPELGERALYMQYMTLLTLQGHYEPLGLDDEFSVRVFDLYMKYLDYNKRFFTKRDYNKLKAEQRKIDDQIKNGEIDFFLRAINLLDQRITDVKKITQEILEEPLDFSVQEALELDVEKRDYPKNQHELRDLWRKIAKHQVLLAYYDEWKNQKAEDQSLPAVGSSVPDEKLLKEAKEKVKKNITASLDRMLEGTIEEKFYLYLDAIANSYDPHTEYIPPQEKDDYDIHLSGAFYGIGATLQKEGENIKVVEIIPGGPSWKQKELQVGDHILQVAQENEEPVDIINMSLNDAVRLIRGEKGTTVRLTVKKPDGQITVISIVRDLVVLEEAYAKSAIVKNAQNQEQYGYIYLPSFYHDFQRTEGRSSAQDVKDQLKELKKAGVSGVILDLRNNTGGLLSDAVEMAGHFLQTGPVVQVKERNGKIRVLQDTDPEVTYEGPLVVLINSFSASASEILAAALQDYGRAVIVGSARTFGKGTVQVVYVSLDDILDYIFPEKQDLKPLGYIKYTIEKFYRITGGSTQLKGVEPDIILPDLYSYLDYGEKATDYPLPWDEIQTLPFEKWHNQLSVADLKKLTANSGQRVAQNQGFQLVNKNIQRVLAEKQSSAQSLKFETFLDQREVEEAEKSAFENLKTQESEYLFTAMNRMVDVGHGAEGDEVFQANAEWIKALSEDFYLVEAINILQDLIAIQAADAL